jgi:hypothetical protein
MIFSTACSNENTHVSFLFRNFRDLQKIFFNMEARITGLNSFQRGSILRRIPFLDSSKSLVSRKDQLLPIFPPLTRWHFSRQKIQIVKDELLLLGRRHHVKKKNINQRKRQSSCSNLSNKHFEFSVRFKVLLCRKEKTVKPILIPFDHTWQNLKWDTIVSWQHEHIQQQKFEIKYVIKKKERNG